MRIETTSQALTRKAKRNSAKTECVNGHALAGVNLSKDYMGNRRCLICARRRNREYMQRVKAGQAVKHRSDAGQ
jgi:hypothetical protein